MAEDYATKRYRSNVVNWGMLPLICPDLAALGLKPGDRLYLPGIRALLEGDGDAIDALFFQSEPDGLTVKQTKLSLPGLTREERDIILAGCLINYYK